MPKFFFVSSVKLNPPVGSQPAVPAAPANPPEPFGTVSRGTSTIALGVHIQNQVVPREVRRHERLIEEIEESDAELQLLLALEREVLEQRHVVIGPERRADIVLGRRIALLPECREGDAIDVQVVLARIATVATAGRT